MKNEYQYNTELDVELSPQYRIRATLHLLQDKESARYNLSNHSILISRGLSQYLTLVIFEHDPSQNFKVLKIDISGRYQELFGEPLVQVEDLSKETEERTRSRVDGFLLQLCKEINTTALKDAA